MPAYVALLRAINLGSRNRIAMADLRALLEALGFRDPRTLLQSGNVVFEGNRRAGAPLESLLEKETAKRLNVSVDYLIRTVQEWETIAASNPFPKQARRDPSHLLVMFLKKAPRANNVKELQAAIRGPEIVRSRGRELYIFYPVGIGRSKLTGALIERKLGIRGTARNWNTVLKLSALTQHKAVRLAAAAHRPL